MEFVDPIRSKQKIAQIKNQLKGAGKYRELLLFVFGINTALRIDDLLKIQAVDVVMEDLTRDYFLMVEEKTGKRHQVTINDSMREAFQLYREHTPGVLNQETNYLFYSRKAKPQFATHIDRNQALRLIWQMTADAGLTGNYGTHSLRKTWGYQARMAGVDLEVIMHKLNHSSFAVTRRYLGITDDEIQAAAMKVNL